MKYYFGGSEIKMWRDLLADRQVPTVSLSFVGLQRRVKATDKWKISANYPKFQSVFLDSGAYTFNREGSEATFEQAHNAALAYMEFAQANVDDLELISEFDAKILGKDAIEKWRADFYNSLPTEKFMPIWHAEDGMDALDALCSAYPVVGVCQADMRDESHIPVFNSLANHYGVRLHGVAITSKRMMEEVAFDSVSSMSWLSPSIYGDTIIWAGKELKRYPKGYKSSRKQHRTYLDQNGFDTEKIENDDSTELLKLSLWSWQQFTASIDSRSVTTHAGNKSNHLAEMGSDAVGMQGVTNRNAELAVRRETETLPVMGLKLSVIETDDERAEEVPFIISRSESMRVCNTCFLRDKCPGFLPDANCLYNIPIKIETKDQLIALRHALIEMQTQRVMFMRMAEDLEGGYADPNLSSEMDRLQRMLKSEADAEREGFTMHLDVSATPGGPGIMQRVFGQQASDQMRALDAPVVADDVIKESEIYEAEVVEQ